jgi:hypothetical protein
VKTICFSLIAVLGLKARRNEVCPHTLEGERNIKRQQQSRKSGCGVLSLLLCFAAPFGGKEWERTRAGVSACAAWECDIIRSISMFRNVICIIPFLADAALGRKARENICLSRAARYRICIEARVITRAQINSLYFYSPIKEAF